MALLSAVILFEILFVFVGWADWSLIFFTLTAYYGLVLPSVPKERLMNIVGIIVSLTIAFIVIVFKGISLKLLFIPASIVLAIPVFYKSDFLNIMDLLRQNNVLFIGELAPFLFGLTFIPTMMQFGDIDLVNTYGRIMMFVNIVLFPVNGFKYLLFSRLKNGGDLNLLSFTYLVIGILGAVCLYIFKSFFGDLNEIVILKYFWPIGVLLLSKILSDLYQQKVIYDLPINQGILLFI